MTHLQKLSCSREFPLAVCGTVVYADRTVRDLDEVDCLPCLRLEVQRLRWQLNHPNDLAIIQCEAGQHPSDCGAPRRSDW